MKKIVSIAIGVLVIGGLGYWLVSGVGKVPGEAVVDQGRDHKSREENEKFVYNSNPPTSGPHDPDWIRPGIYNESQDKYKLIHSLEHGYVVVHYNCALPISKSEFLNPKQFSMIQIAKAHEDEGDADGDSTPSATFKADCSLAQTLADWAKKMGLKKLIVQPNPAIDKPMILVAWDRVLRMDKWDAVEAEKFVKAFRNRGPEATIE